MAFILSPYSFLRDHPGEQCDGSDIEIPIDHLYTKMRHRQNLHRILRFNPQLLP